MQLGLKPFYALGAFLASPSVVTELSSRPPAMAELRDLAPDTLYDFVEGLADFDRMRLNLIGQRLAYLVNTYGATEEVRDFVYMLIEATDWEVNDDGLGDSEADSDEDWDEREDYDESEVYDYDESEVDDSD